MILDAGLTRARTRFHYGLVAFALATVLGIGASGGPAHAGIQDRSDALPADTTPPAVLQPQAAGQDVIVVAEKDHKNWNKGKNNNWNKNWSKNNNNWNNKNWKHNNKNWSKNYNKNWNNNWPRHWGNYNNNWNKNWNNRAYVRNWNRRPYYGEFVGGIVLGSILAATGVGIVPYAPEPNLCWYWADPYMQRGYWDYCY